MADGRYSALLNITSDLGNDRERARSRSYIEYLRRLGVGEDTPNAGAQFRKGLTVVSVAAAAFQGIQSLIALTAKSSLEGQALADALLVLLLAGTATHYHSPSDGECWTFERRGVPLFLSYAGTAAASLFATRFAEEALRSALVAAGTASVGATFASLSIPVSVITTVCLTYRCVGYDRFANAAATTRDYLSGCVKGTAALFRSCGMKLWNCRKKSDEPLAKSEALLAAPTPRPNSSV